MLLLFLISCCAGAELHHAASSGGPRLLSRVNNELIPRLFKHLDGTKEENVVFSPVGLVQNLAVIAEVSNDSLIKQEIVQVLKLSQINDLDTLRTEFEHVLMTFEHESSEGENSTEATGLFNYLHTSPGHDLKPALVDRLARSFRTNISEDTSLEAGLFSASADTGVLSHWKEREALAVFTVLQHSAAAPFTLNNGTVRVAPLVPHIGRFEAREHPHFSLVKLPLQASSTKLILLLPKSADHFASLVDAMPAVDALTDSQDGVDHPREEIELWIPQMLAISSLELRHALVKLGAKRLFEADLSGVTKSASPVHLSSISQKSFFTTSFTSIKSITESGLQLSALSNESTRRRRRRRRRQVTSQGPSQRSSKGPRTLVFNKPFLFMIERADLRLVLTAGCINDPTQFPAQF